jgi:hypothetical protein
MEMLSEALQEEAWAKIRPLLEGHRIIAFILLNILLSAGLLDLIIETSIEKTLSQIPEILAAFAQNLKIGNVVWTALLCFFFSPWLSRRLNWLLLSKIQIKLAFPLVRAVRDFAEVVATQPLLSTDRINSIFDQERRALVKFGFLRTLCELWVVAIPVGYFQISEKNTSLSLMAVILTLIGFFALSQRMMVIFLRYIVPALLIRQAEKLRNPRQS